jgi:hypothetical protein
MLLSDGYVRNSHSVVQLQDSEAATAAGTNGAAARRRTWVQQPTARKACSKLPNRVPDMVGRVRSGLAQVSAPGLEGPFKTDSRAA